MSYVNLSDKILNSISIMSQKLWLVIIYIYIQIISMYFLNHDNYSFKYNEKIIVYIFTFSE